MANESAGLCGHIRSIPCLRRLFLFSASFHLAMANGLMGDVISDSITAFILFPSLIGHTFHGRKTANGRISGTCAHLAEYVAVTV